MLFQTTPLPFTFRAPPMPGLRWRNPQLSHITLRPGGGGEFTPHIITSGNPHDPGFGPEAKSPRGEITHHLATLLSPFWYAVMPLPTRYGMIW